MKVIGKSAIHDEGFRFYLLLKIESKIESLIKDIKVLQKCIENHDEWKKESWYDSKTAIRISEDIEGYDFTNEFTRIQAVKLLNERKKMYELLIGMAEKSLELAKEYTIKHPNYEVHKPWSKDLERINIIVEQSNEDK